MKIIVQILCIALIACSLSGFSLAAERIIEGQEAKALMRRLEQSREKTIIGHFSEERKIAAIPAPLVFSGRIYAMPPDFLFMAYEAPFAHIMKVSGGTVLFYVDGAATADEIDLTTLDNGKLPPAAFAWSPVDFTGMIVETDSSYELRDSKGDDGEVKIILDRKSLALKEVCFQGDNGDSTRIVVTDLQTGREIPPEILHFQLPAGVKINHPGQ